MFKKLLLSSAFSLAGFSALAEPVVVTSIRPVHSLVASVMEGAGEPVLIVDGAASPHDFHLKPSHATALSRADLVVFIDEGLEAFLQKPLETVAGKARHLPLADTPGLKLLPWREGGVHEDDHDDHGHDNHADHKGHDDHDDHADHKGHDDHDDHADHKGHDDHDDHADHKGHDDHDDHADHKGHDDHDDHADHKGHDDHDDHADHKGHDDHDDHADHKGHDDHEDHAGHDGHDHGGAHDVHVWLNPDNAMIMADAIANALVSIDPANADLYRKNAKNLHADLASLDSELQKQLASARERSFVTFHDAFQYFDNHYGLKMAGVITVNPEIAPSAKRIREMRHHIAEQAVHCIFAEPQFPEKIVRLTADGLKVKTAVLDPLGANLDAGPDLYGNLLRDMARSISGCLGS